MTKNPFLLVGGLLLVISLFILPATAQIQSNSSSQIPFNDTLSGYRNTGQLYTFQIKNVSGTADIVYHYTVYASRLIGTNYTYHSRNWNTWEVQDAAAEYQYLIVWVRGWSEGTTWLGWGRDRFSAWVWGNLTIQPEPVHLEDLPVRYGSEKYRPVLIKDLFNRVENGDQLTTEWYGWKDGYQRYRMEPGISNADDGILIYQVPAAATPEDIQIAGWFGYYGTAVWNLKDKEIQQDSLENERLQELEVITLQRAAGIRISDRTLDRRRA